MKVTKRVSSSTLSCFKALTRLQKSSLSTTPAWFDLYLASTLPHSPFATHPPTTSSTSKGASSTSSGSYLSSALPHNEIESMAHHFFSKHFSSHLSECKDAQSLNSQLSSITTQFQHHDSHADKSDQKSSSSSLDTFAAFESHIVRLAYHGCITRLTNELMLKSSDSMEDQLTWLNTWLHDMETKYNVCDHETFELILDGLINKCYIGATGTEASEKMKEVLEKAINGYYEAFERFLNETDAPLGSFSDVGAGDANECGMYLKEQNRRYQGVFSSYISYLLVKFEMDGCDNSLNKAIEAFYNGLEHGVIPKEREQLQLMRVIGEQADVNDWQCVDCIFKLLMHHSTNCPDIEYFNDYLKILSKFGNLDESIEILRLLLFHSNSSLSLPSGATPSPNLRTFEIILIDCLRNGMSKNAENEVRFDASNSKERKESSVGGKVKWVLKQMKSLQIDSDSSKSVIYKSLYEMLGGSFWDTLPWHLKVQHRPQ